MRKIFGVILILLGLILTLVIFFGSLPFMFREAFRVIEEQNRGYIGAVVGLVISLMIFSTINFTLYFFGFKLLKNKKKELIPIPDEDFPSQLK